VASPHALRRWKEGVPLSEAWSVFASSSSPDEKGNSRKIAPQEFSPKSGMGMLLARLDDTQREGLVKAVTAIETFTDSVREKLEFENQLKNDFLKKLQKGELVAFGYSVDAAATAPPIQIPQRFFVGRFFDWRLDVISDPPIEFRQVRIVRADIGALKVTSVKFKKPGRPSDQGAMFDALKVLVENNPTFHNKQRKIQSDEIQKFLKSKGGRVPSLRTISKSIPVLFERLKLNSTG
jgi:hypothetical protein